jgi:hypothetical protein
LCDVSINMVSKILVDAGKVCAAYHDQYVRGLTCKRVQCDEIWWFCYSKERNVQGAKKAPKGRWQRLDVDGPGCIQCVRDAGVAGSKSCQSDQVISGFLPSFPSAFKAGRRFDRQNPLLGCDGICRAVRT